MSETDREVQATSFWGKVIIGAILIPTISGFIWIGQIDTRVEQNEKQIDNLQLEINDMERDIRAILIGIEQVKARLGIVEQE